MEITDDDASPTVTLSLTRNSIRETDDSTTTNVEEHKTAVRASLGHASSECDHGDDERRSTRPFAGDERGLFNQFEQSADLCRGVHIKHGRSNHHRGEQRCGRGEQDCGKWKGAASNTVWNQ